MKKYEESRFNTVAKKEQDKAEEIYEWADLFHRALNGVRRREKCSPEEISADLFVAVDAPSSMYTGKEFRN